MRSLRTPAAVLLAMLTAFLLCGGLTAEPHYVFGMGHPDLPVQFASLTSPSVRPHASGVVRAAARHLPLMQVRRLMRLCVLAALLALMRMGMDTCALAPGSRRRLMAFYINSPKLAPPARLQRTPLSGACA